ncbi:MAG: hypothetical protein WC284_03875 [Candidimonas sp.]|jgi:hypothetical protein
MLTSLFSGVPLGILSIKMFTTAFVVMAVAWSVGIFGPLIGGAIAGLPIILGPGFYFLVTQESVSFIHQAAIYSLLSMCATQFFLLAYIATARTGKPWLSLGCAFLSWVTAIFLFQLLPIRLMVFIVLFLITTSGCQYLGAKYLTSESTAKGNAGFALLLARGLLAGVLVAAVTTASQWLGPVGAGLLLAFPVGFTVVSVTIHQKFGANSVIATLHSAMLGTASLAGFCIAMASTVLYLPPMAAFVIAMAVSSFITLGLVFRHRIPAMFKRL